MQRLLAVRHRNCQAEGPGFTDLASGSSDWPASAALLWIASPENEKLQGMRRIPSDQTQNRPPPHTQLPILLVSPRKKSPPLLRILRAQGPPRIKKLFLRELFS